MTRPLAGGLLIAVVQGALVLSLAAKQALDRQQLPRAWVKARPECVSDPIRGRYLRVPVSPAADPGLAPRDVVVNGRTIRRDAPVTIEARDGRLLAHAAPASRLRLVTPPQAKESGPVLWPPVEYFIPDSADAAPFLVASDLWIEVSVPHSGPPRPVALGRMQNGHIVRLGR